MHRVLLVCALLVGTALAKTCPPTSPTSGNTDCREWCRSIFYSSSPCEDLTSTTYCDCNCDDTSATTSECSRKVIPAVVVGIVISVLVCCGLCVAAGCYYCYNQKRQSRLGQAQGNAGMEMTVPNTGFDNPAAAAAPPTTSATNYPNGGYPSYPPGGYPPTAFPPAYSAATAAGAAGGFDDKPPSYDQLQSQSSA